MNPKPWPWNEIPTSSPADWGEGMTVCIAGPSTLSNTIFCVTDMMLSMSDSSMSGDSLAAKMAFFGPNWTVMMAGDLSPYLEIRERVKEALPKKLSGGALTRYIFAETLKEAFIAERKRRQEAEILSPFDLDFSNYRDEGPKLGPEMYSRILFELREFDLGLSLLVAGFDDNMTCVFKVEGRGIAHNYGCPWAIGSGDQAAIGYLFATQTNIFCDADEMLYRVCCAKFSAETSLGVGKETKTVMMRKGKEQEVLSEGDIKAIREDWKKTRQLELPDRKKKIAADIIQAKISQSQTST